MNIQELSYTDNLEIPVSGSKPTGGYLNYENSVLKDGCLTIDEYKITIQNGEVTKTEKGQCGGMSLTACDSPNFHPSPESWFTFDETTNTITGFSESWDGTTDITVPCSINGNEVKEIGRGAFSRKILTSVIIGDNIEKIGEGAFYECAQLEKAILGKSIEEIKTATFSNNTSLKDIRIPNSVQAIGSQAFYNNTSLKDIKIPNSVQTIADGTFQNCTSLKYLDLGQGVKTIGGGAFQRTIIEELIIPDSVTELARGAFGATGENPRNTIKKLELGNGIKKTNGEFMDFSNLKTLILREGLEEIGGGEFSGTGIEEIVIPNSVKKIGGGAFAGCPNLKTITLGTELNELESGVFYLSTPSTTLESVYNNSSLTKEQLEANNNFGGRTGYTIY